MSLPYVPWPAHVNESVGQVVQQMSMGCVRHGRHSALAKGHHRLRKRSPSPSPTTYRHVLRLVGFKV